MDEIPGTAVAFALGELKAQNKAQDDRLASMESSVSAINGKMDTVLGHIERQRGARKVTAALATACGALGAMAVQWFSTK